MKETEKQPDSSKKKRIYQVAKDFHISNEAVIEFLELHKFKVRNIMAPLTDEQVALLCGHFQKEKEETETQKEPDFRKKIQEKKKEEEARKQAIRQEIDEILEFSKGDLLVVVEPEKKPAKADRRKPETAVPADRPAEAEEAAVPPAGDEAAAPAPARIPLPVIQLKPEPGAKEKSKSGAGKPKRHLKRRPAADEEAGGGPRIILADDDAKERKGRKDSPAVPAAQFGTGHRKKKKKRKKAGTPIDEKAIEASIRETLAKMGDTSRRRKHRKEKEAGEEAETSEVNVIQTTEFASVAELANLMDVESSEVIKACLSLGLMVSINQRLDRDTIIMLADEFGYEVKFLSAFGENVVENREDEAPEQADPSLLKPRSPVVTIMGHVDHGKTSLLDHIRESNIIAGESGGITQHIGAYEVEFRGRKITFLDTPGHEAFTAMRARGAQITDIVVLVVAADDSVMPQTIEAINHAKAAGVPIVVAINKIDRPQANPELIRKQLSEHNVLVEQWGGKTQCAEISAKTGQGVEHLLDLILLEAEVLELKANPEAKPKAVVVEARLDRGKGVVSTVLVQKGTLRVGDPFIAGQFNGRVRAMFDERYRPVREALPATPVQVLGFTGMPQAGDQLVVFDSESEAREIALKRQQLRREQSFRQVRRLTLDQISKRIADGEVKELMIVLKADVDGSLEAIADTLMEIKHESVGVRIIHRGVGAITESDVLLAEASQAVVLGFNVDPTAKARDLAAKEDVDIRLYSIIYDLVNDIKLALEGMLEPEKREEVIGSLEIRNIFKASKIGLIAGCFVVSGKIARNNTVRIKRDGKLVQTARISSLKRFKDDVREVAAGFECGLTLENFEALEVGDTLEAIQVVETARTLGA
ncbi:MAG: translation initiation factor IF-2 [bacterium]|nr:translation initiation factor IF-2 [bacterium]